MIKSSLLENTYDVAVIGAGSAGLQAAQTLGRMHQSTIVIGTDRYRNDPTAHMHNFLGHDGVPPSELRAAGRRDAEAYDDVHFLDLSGSGVTAITGELGAFVLSIDGAPDVMAHRVLLATGVGDTLPDVPGIAENFGDLVAHCPFCHGHEFAGTRVGILGVPVETTPVAGVRRDGDALVLSPGDVRLGGLFVKTDWSPAPFIAELGLDLSEMGAVVVDAFGRTSRPGIYAAGDLAQGPGLPMPMASVLTAASAGMMAGAACVQDAALARIA